MFFHIDRGDVEREGKSVKKETTQIVFSYRPRGDVEREGKRDNGNCASWKGNWPVI